MSTTADSELAPPRVESMPPRTLAGFSMRYDCDDPSHIPGQWQRFAPYIGRVEGQVDYVTYGICHNFDNDNHYDYVCAVEVSSTKNLPDGFTVVDFAAQRYLVFSHPGHVSNIRHSISAAWSAGLPNSGYEAVESGMLERYGPEFDGNTGMGGLEIWIPIAE